MPDVNLAELAHELYARRHTAVTVPYIANSFSVGLPAEHECHNNCDRYALDNPGFKTVRGWLVFDYNKTTEGWWPICRFTAHSVLEADDGTLIDITPSQASQRYPFLRHDGPEGQFEAIVLAGHVNLDLAIGVD